MKKLILFVATLALVGIGGYLATQNSDESNLNTPVLSVFKDTEIGFQFDYRKGPDGYVTLENTESTDPDYATGITLLNKKEYEAFKESTEPREGPTAINVRVYRNALKLDPPVWATRKPRESNIELAFEEPKESVVGGANATFYTADGLYPTETYVVASGEHVYIISGSYMSREDAIYQDFQKLISSFNFIPTTR